MSEALKEEILHLTSQRTSCLLGPLDTEETSPQEEQKEEILSETVAPDPSPQTNQYDVLRTDEKDDTAVGAVPTVTAVPVLVEPDNNNNNLPPPSSDVAVNYQSSDLHEATAVPESDEVNQLQLSVAALQGQLLDQNEIIQQLRTSLEQLTLSLSTSTTTSGEGDSQIDNNKSLRGKAECDANKSSSNTKSGRLCRICGAVKCVAVVLFLVILVISITVALSGGKSKSTPQSAGVRDTFSPSTAPPSLAPTLLPEESGDEHSSMSITLIAVFSSVGFLSLLGVAVFFFIRLKRKQSLRKMIESQQQNQSSDLTDTPKEEQVLCLRQTVASLQRQLSSRKAVAAQLQVALHQRQQKLRAMQEE